MKKPRLVYIQQRDVMGCGAACLSMICTYYGKWVDLEYVEELCGSTAHGISMHGLAETAELLGFDTAGIKTDIRGLSKIPLPCIIHWNQNHFVVLNKYDSKRRKYEVMDPGEGKFLLDSNTFRKHWLGAGQVKSEKGLLLAMRPKESFYKNQGDKKKALRVPAILLSYLKNYRSLLLQIILGLGLGCVLQLIMPFLTQWIVDIGIRHSDIRFIWLVLLGELMIVVGRTATDFIRRWLLLHISMRINISLVSDFFIKLL
ncbi:MAG: hypothetical protein K2M13_02375, partial [Muribaculaceae bacterium]|nr:hypothetical protein [Muribaculaceae bacterium]